LKEYNLQEGDKVKSILFWPSTGRKQIVKVNTLLSGPSGGEKREHCN
jgi:hypothetical protein